MILSAPPVTGVESRDIKSAGRRGNVPGHGNEGVNFDADRDYPLGTRLMPAPQEKTRFPGVYKRGTRYTYTWRDRRGRQRWGSARTLAGARAAKADEEAKAVRGEGSDAARENFHEYARAWVKRYQGTGRRGFREETRNEYEGLLEKYTLKFFGAHLRVVQIEPRDVAEFVAWLVKQPNGREGERKALLADKTVRNVLAPLRACLATARQEGLIRVNPADGVALPHRPVVQEDDEEVRPFTREQLGVFLDKVDPRYRLLFEFAAATGLRASELIGLEWRHMHLDGGEPHVRVRQRVRAGKVGPLKTRYARREIPLSFHLTDQLRARRVELHPVPGAPVFCAPAGGRLHKDNVWHRVIHDPVRQPAAEADASWAGWHTFRHTCASLLFDRGANAVQVQRWLGHHDPGFTLKTYVHLLEGRIDAPLEPVDLLGADEPEKDVEVESVNGSVNGTDRNQPNPAEVDPVTAWLDDIRPDQAAA